MCRFVGRNIRKIFPTLPPNKQDVRHGFALRLNCRKTEAETRTRPFTAFGADMSPVFLHDLAAQGQADASPGMAAGRIERAKHPEKLLRLRGFKTYAVVGYCYLMITFIQAFIADADAEWFPGITEMDGVFEQVVEH